MTEAQQDKFESWGLLELFGRQRLAGRISEQTIGGIAFLRIDVPAVEGAQAYTRFFTSGAIYGLTPMTEETTMQLAKQLRSAPVSRYDVMPLLTAQSRSGDDDY